ncbi:MULTISPECIES: hypothetical protein [Bacteroides]|uniref:hypothetical protein n=1 Tax=Bacteroides TaxID=816 RepID=UPI001CE2E342|nr:MULTISPECIES: hypothetical protein [Bacteroides]MCA6023195.1 hypothetical protein [Bacteroides thetaiotaomicron]MCB6635037.1 hypothetical protein [Bacteroides faecis]MDC1569881.1 hypothetical protein [Phocaeicola vulgatus]
MEESGNIFSIKHLPAVNERVKQLVDFYANGSVKRFSEMIHLSSSQKLNRVFNLDKRNNEYPEVSSDILLSIANMFADINTEWLLTGRGEMINIQTSTFNNKTTLPQKESTGIEDKLLAIIADKDATIREMAEEIGVLKQTIVQLKQESAGRVSDANDSTVANAI